MLTRGVSHPDPHTGAVDVLIGTSEGLFRLADGVIASVAATETTAISGEWAVVEEAEVVSLDSGVTATTAPLSAECVAPFGDGALVGTETARLFRLDADGGADPVESFDRIAGRDGWYTPFGAPPATRSLTVTSDGVPFVNVHVGGVWRGDPALTEWSEVVAVDDDTHQVLASSSGPLVVVAAAVGFGWSTDGGRTFSWTTDGLHASYSRAVALGDTHVFVSSSTGPSTKRGAVYRRPIDSDQAFERCSNGLPAWFEFNINTFQLVADGRQVAIGTRDGEVYTSEDEGSSWQLAAKDLPPIRCVALR
jgi:hypothetical protein